jgi:HK97 family phage major capsid protein
MTGAGTAYWVAENNAPTESDQTTDQVLMSPKTVAGWTDISRRLLHASHPSMSNRWCRATSR